MNTLPLDFSGLSAHSSADEIQERLEAVRHIYETAKKRVAGEDKEWNEKVTYLQRKMVGLVNTFKESDPPHVASYRLGMLQSITEELAAPRMIVLQFEAEERRFQTRLGAKGGSNKGSK